MAVIAIAVGLFVFLFTGAFISDVVVHSKDAGLLPGLVLGIWAAWPFFHKARVQRYNFLHPVPKEFNVPAKVAFQKVRDLLAEVSYNFGDKWHIATVDTQAGRIAASLHFTEEQVRLEADVHGHIHPRKERFQRFVGLNLHFKNTGHGTVIIQLDFSPKVEGANFFACDLIVSNLCSAIESTLGSGTQVGSPADTRLSAPPWWLLGLSALSLFVLCGDVIKAVFQ